MMAISVSLGLLVGSWTTVAAQSGREAVCPFGEVTLSPDGRRVAWVGPGSESVRDLGLYVADIRAIGAGRPRRISGGVRGTEAGLAWSPDGRHLAFLAQPPRSSREALYVANLGTGVIDRRTHFAGSLTAPKWSPDGRSIALLWIEHPTRIAGPTQPTARDTGLISRRETDIQRLAVLDLSTGRLRAVSPVDLYVHEYDWSPDGTRFVVAANVGPGDNGWYRKGLYVIVRESAAIRAIVEPELQVARPRWSPDGESVAYVGGLMSDESSVGGDIYLVPAAGGAPKNLTPALAGSASSVWWSPTGPIVFTAFDGGGTSIGTVDPHGGGTTVSWHGEESISANRRPEGGIALARDGRTTALIRQSFSRPPEVWIGPIGAWTQVTRANARVTPDWGESHLVQWTSDTLSISGWLIEPARVQANRRYPMVVAVHGGPAEVWTSRWPRPSSMDDALLSRLTSSGYYVFLPNPRGSLGQGQAFTRANARDFGYGDFRDLTAGVDAVLTQFPIDSTRVGITGRSYGGYMAMWAVTQTPRFRGAVAVAGIANWQSYWAQNGINDWMRPYFGATIYEDPALYARSAPISFIRQVRTPTLVVVGERDQECPAPQSFEFWRGAATAGAEVELVVYADEGHSIRQPGHLRDFLDRAVAWFDRHLER